MGSNINTINIALPSSMFSKGYIPCAVEAVKKCLIDKNVAANQVGILVNTAIYRDAHIVEPSLSSLILGEIVRAPFFRKRSYANRLKKILTFDLNNGASGLIQAIQLIDVFIKSGKIESGIVVAGDSNYKSGNVKNYSFLEGAAAILLSRGAESKGFIGFKTDTYLQYKTDIVGYSHFANERINLTIEEKSSFCKHAILCASSSLEKFLEEQNLSLVNIDLVICSQYPDGFAEGIRDRFQLNDKVIQLAKDKNSYHTAAPLFILNSIMGTNKYKSARNILFITVGAGITVSIALYNK